MAEIRKPRASINIPKIAGSSPTALEFRCRTNGWSTMEVSYDMPGELVKSVSDASEMSLMNSLQAYGRTSRSETDFNAEIFDGKSSASFEGFIQGPGLMYGKGYINRSVQACGVAARLEGLNFGPYGEAADAWADLSDGFQSGSFSDFIKQGVEFVMKQGETYARTDMQGESNRALFDILHTANTALVPVLLELLKASDEDTKSDTLKAFLGGSGGADSQVAYGLGASCCLANTIRGSIGFSRIISSLCALFDLVYIPSFKGPGRLIRRSAMLDTAGTIELPSGVQVTLSEGQPGGLLPPQAVVVVAAGSEGWCANSVSNDSAPMIFNVYPKYFEGSAAIMPFPAFVQTAATLNAAGGTGKVSVDSRYEVESYEAKRKILHASVKAMNTNVEALLQEMAEHRFMDLQYAGSSGSVVLPLSVQIECGKRYNIVGEKSAMFSGFCDGLTHAIRLQDNQISGTTTVNLTHVKYA